MALSWTRSFLSGGSHIINFAGSHVINFAGQQSACSPLICKVLQGSVLGPLLFSLYSADVISITQPFGVGVHCYADNLHLFVYCCVSDTTATIERLLC